MKWKKLKPLERSVKNVTRGCLNCGFASMKLKMNTKIVQGFGGEYITRNGKVFFWPENWDGTDKGWKRQKTLTWVENQARKDPNNDWRLVCEQPLHGGEYQRQGKNNWVMVSKNKGFV